MESPVEDETVETPLNEVKPHRRNSILCQNRSAPHSLSKSGLTPCRRVGLKRKSTPGIIFQSPLKDNNSRICCQTATSSAPSLGKNNLFSKTLNRSSQGENAFKPPTSEQGKAKETHDLLTHKPELNSTTDKTYKKLSLPRSATPILSRHGRVTQCSLSKKLKLSSESASDCDNGNSENSLSYVPKFKEVLIKNYDGFLKLYDDFISEDLEDGAKNPQKHEAIIRMKKIFDQIEEIKPSLMNAKQHDLLTLETLAKKWRDGCQKALYTLLGKLQQQGHKCDMSQLLLESGIPSKLVNYNDDIQDFIN